MTKKSNIVCFSNETALALIRLLRTGLASNGPSVFEVSARPLLPLVPGNSMPAPGDIGSLLESARTIIGDDEALLHFQTTKQFQIAAPNSVTHVVDRRILEAAHLRIGDNLLCTNPEETLLRLSAGSSLVHALGLCNEFSGCFSLSPGRNHVGMVRTPPITSPKLLERFLERLPSVPGKARLREALRWMIPNAASPVEASIAQPYMLPKKLGGYNIPGLRLNFKVTGRASAGGELRTFYLDIYWPELKLAIEYDSDEFHFGEKDSIYRDAERRIVLGKLGIQTVVITKAQLGSLGMLDNAARIVARKAGISLRLNRGDYRERRLALHRELFPQFYTDDKVPCECYFL